jgi:putative endonuclease
MRTPAGEVDIAALDRGVLVIVEVKSRREHRAALEAVSNRQRRRLAGAALYIAGQYSHPNIDRGLRFDVVVVQPWHWPRHLRDAWRPAPD